MKTRAWLERILHMWPVKILSLGAAVLLFFFTNLLNLGSRDISLPIHYTLPSGFTQASEFPTKAKLTLRGDSDTIYGIAEDELQIQADFSKHTKDGQYQVALRLKRSGAAANVEPLDVRIEPGAVKVSLEASVTREVPVNIRFVGNPKPGYQLITYTVSPKTILLSGPASHMEGISSVDTNPIDLSARAQDFIQKAQVDLTDPLIRVSDVDALEVKGMIGETVNKKTFVGLSLVIIGLSPDLVYDSSLPSGTVTIQADAGVLQKIAQDQIRILVDASQIKTAGTYQLKSICDPPPNSLVLSVDPMTVNLVVTQAITDRSKL